jgi:hypothetical protein
MSASVTRACALALLSFHSSLCTFDSWWFEFDSELEFLESFQPTTAPLSTPSTAQYHCYIHL